MAGSQTQFIHWGPYVDYGRSAFAKHQWLWSTSAATIWTNFLGILVTTAGARLFRIVLRIRALAHAANHPNRLAVNPACPTCGLQTPSGTSGTPLVAPNQVPTSVAHGGRVFHSLAEAREETALESRGWHTFLELVRDLRPGAVRLTGAGPLNTRRSNRVGSRLLKSCAYLGIFVGILICGILTAQLATDSTALSASPDCGIYVPNITSGLDDTYLITKPYESDAQLDSADWARNCFHTDDGTDGCNFFVQQSISYTVEHNATCPFPDYMCYGGASSALSFSTGAVNAREIGVNAPSTWEFERNTTCSPLNMNETFIRLSRNGREYTFSYYYGAGDVFGDHSWETKSYGTNLGQSPSYLVGALRTADAATWDPIPELQPPPHSTTTIVFILPQKIYYPRPSTDPVFPANRLRHLPGSPTPYWLYTRGHATVLACLDSTRWRDPLAPDPAWRSPREPRAPVADARVAGGVELLWAALQNSNMYQTLSGRLTSALDAQRLLTGFSSRPLAEEQWKVEATQLFETSLARIMVDARDVARGGMARYAGYGRVGMGAGMCEGRYLFKSEGWVNVSGGGSLLVLVPCLLVVFCAIPVDAERLVMPDLILGRWAQPCAVAAVGGVVVLGEEIALVVGKVGGGMRRLGRACIHGIVGLGDALRGFC